MENIDSEITDYWQAVADDDLITLEKMLSQDMELLHRRIYGEPFEIGFRYDPNLKKKVRAEKSFRHSSLALHFAARNGKTDLAKLLLGRGSKVDEFCFDSNKGFATALILAAWEGNIETMEALLQHGANPSLPASAETALYTASEHHSWDKVEMLLKYGARHDVFTATICGEVDLVRMHIEAYPPLLEARSLKRNLTPLEESILHKQENATSVIIEMMEKADW